MEELLFKITNHPILDAQDVNHAPYLAIRDFAELKGPRPTENLGLQDVKPKIVPKIEETEIPESVSENNFRVNPKLVEYILSLVNKGNKKLEVLKYDLEYVASNHDVRDVLNKFRGDMSADERRTMLGFLPTEGLDGEGGGIVSDTEAHEKSIAERIKHLGDTHGIFLV